MKPIVHLFSKSLKKRYNQRISSLSNSICFHPVSVGEVNAIKPLIQLTKKKNPQFPIVLTTMTETGHKSAQSISRIHTYLFPIDIPFLIKQLYAKLNPQVLVVAETEIWPYLFITAKNRKVPVVLVNARLSDSSFKNYKRFKCILKPAFSTINKICTQSCLDKEKFQGLGFENVINTGNLKFSLNLTKFNKLKVRKRWKFTQEDFIIVWGSSRPGEETLILDIYKRLCKKYDIKLILAPRHLKRLSEIKEIFSGENFRLFSDLDKTADSFDILIIDKMGLLTKAYSIGNIAIIGGSFFDFGGHNPLEAAFYGLPIIIGNYHKNCLNSVRRLQKNSAIRVSNKENLQKEIITLIENKSLRKYLGKEAFKTVKSNKESLEKNYNIIKEFIN